VTVYWPGKNAGKQVIEDLKIGAVNIIEQK
jgi:hypothetical protein